MANVQQKIIYNARARDHRKPLLGSSMLSISRSVEMMNGSVHMMNSRIVMMSAAIIIIMVGGRD